MTGHICSNADFLFVCVVVVVVHSVVDYIEVGHKKHSNLLVSTTATPEKTSHRVLRKVIENASRKKSVPMFMVSGSKCCSGG